MRGLANRLRVLADRFDPDRAVVLSPLSFTFEPGRGAVVNDTGRGCPLWVVATDYDRAWAEADARWDEGAP